MSFWKRVKIFGDGAWGDTGTDYDIRVTSDGELATTSTEREKNVLVHYQVTALAATAYHILVDKSDTTNFPHTETGRLDISWARLVVEKSAAVVIGEIELGYITRIDGTDADIFYMTGIQFLKGQDILIIAENNYQPSQVKMDESRFITNVQETTANGNAAPITTASSLPNPTGVNTAPEVGDIIIKYSYTSGGTGYDADIELLYHGEA